MVQILEITGYTCHHPTLLLENSFEVVELSVRVKVAGVKCVQRKLDIAGTAIKMHLLLL